jgi:hypothetical protein
VYSAKLPRGDTLQYDSKVREKLEELSKAKRPKEARAFLQAKSSIDVSTT